MFIAMAGMCCLEVTLALAGPSGGQANFLESSRRQDFTGEGTYHRIGLLREQDAAINRASAAQPKATRSPKPNLWQWLSGLFQPRSSKSPSGGTS
jgi:hypothetical protein